MSGLGLAIKFAFNTDCTRLRGFAIPAFFDHPADRVMTYRGDAASQQGDDLDRVPDDEVSDPIDKEIGAV